MKHSIILSLLFAICGASAHVDTDVETLYRRFAPALQGPGHSSEMLVRRYANPLQPRGACGSKGCAKGSKAREPMVPSKAQRINLEHTKHGPANYAGPSIPNTPSHLNRQTRQSADSGAADPSKHDSSKTGTGKRTFFGSPRRSEAASGPSTPARSTPEIKKASAANLAALDLRHSSSGGSSVQKVQDWLQQSPDSPM